jgi:uncharacterized protein (TIGR00297 family)
MPLIHAALLSAAAALAGWRARALSGGGAWTALLVGVVILGGAGWPAAAALGAFFVTASLVSRLAEHRQPEWVDARGTRRDPWQVLANGGAAMAGGLVAWQGGDAGLWIAVPALAAASADTWATSLGAFSRHDPVLIVSGRRVARGASGGVSLPGTAGGLVGAALVGGAAVAVGGPPALGLAATALGVLGMVADSVLGATVQGHFHCPACDVRSERRRHRCGTPTRPTGGWRWLGNDGVNLVATALAGVAGLGWWACWSP